MAWAKTGNIKGATGATGSTGPAGPGLPAGGTSGQVPVKASTTDYDTAWHTLAPSDVGAVPTSAEGQANGVATLDSGAHLPTAQLPPAIATLLGAWTAWTPTYDSGYSYGSGATVNATYMQIGKTVLLRATVTVGSGATSNSNQVKLYGMPAAPALSEAVVGTWYLISGGNVFGGQCRMLGSPTRIYLYNPNGNSFGILSSPSYSAFASAGSIWSINCMYEAA